METTTNIIIIVWALSEIFLLLKMRSGSSAESSKDKKSLSHLWIVIGFSIFFSIYIAKESSFHFYSNLAFQIIGLAFLMLGVIFRLAVVYNLGKYFTVDVTIMKNHKLITDGFYKYIRHPSYTFSLLTFVGLALVLNNWISAIVLLIPVFSMFFYRIKIEEKVLKVQFGTAYTDYMKHTKKVLPFIY
ncbi:methyltransferase family protein [Halpernia sp. GG3]